MLKLKCPKCYEPVFPNGTCHHDRNTLPQYHHRKSQKLKCNYNGSAPIGIEKVKQKGFSKQHSKTLKTVVVQKKYCRYVITSAQNATPINQKAFQSLLTYCKKNDAQLLIIPNRYKNPTSIWSQRAKGDDWWAEELKPYIISERVFLSPHIILLGDIMTQPTAERPLSGFETITGGHSAIIGHPKLELITVPTPQQKLPKILTTTGSITIKNYIRSKAGKKGEHHHTFGAALVEVDGTHFHLRQLNITNDGSFCDLLNEYDGTEVRQYKRIPALVLGDVHVAVIDPKVVAATFTDRDSMVNVLKPEQIVWHDVFDGTSLTHHERGRLFHEYIKFHAAKRNVEQELNQTLEFIDKVTPKDTKNIFVASNHNSFLQEWVENINPKLDPENVMFWAETFLAVAKNKDTKWTPSGVEVCDPFSYWAQKRLKTASQATFLKRNESYLIKGIEVAYHGDKGPSGARGSRMGFRKIGVKSILGHGHCPGITDGVVSVGTSSKLDLTYSHGHPSAWLSTHAAIYPNGKRSLLSVIDGKWRQI